MNTKKTIDAIIENLFYALPVIHKRIMKIGPPEINCGINISRIHFGILAALHHNQSPITEIANEFLISKSQMTYIMNQLVKAGLIKRSVNPRDRRIKDTVLTLKGNKVFQQCDEYIKNNVRSMFADLTQKELEELATSFQKLKELGPKLEQRGTMLTNKKHQKKTQDRMEMH
jgi:DNA-binding MarR family transcriptional regulator